MLAADIRGQFDELKFPLLATPKIDGIRCLTPEDWEPLSRHLKPIPNRHIRSLFHEHARALHGLDGELIARDLDARAQFQETSSAVMSHDGEPKFTYVVFDMLPHVHHKGHTTFHHEWGYADRCKYLEEWRQREIEHWPDWAEVLSPVEVPSLDALLKLESNMVDELGYEGIILRRPDGKYKFGRSTLREHLLLKYKRFVDSEGIIVEVKPLQRNVGPGFRNEVGALTHHYRQENMREDEAVGALAIRDDANFPGLGLIHVGSGLGEMERYELWRDRKKIIGRVIKYKYCPCGIKNLPRHPVFIGFRED